MLSCSLSYAARRPKLARARAPSLFCFAHTAAPHGLTHPTFCNTHIIIKGPNAESRAQVQSGRVVTPNYGEVRLDPEPDQRLVSC